MAGTARAEHTYRYLHESTYAPGDGVGLASAGGREANPFFFRGFVADASQTARGLLAVAEVSRTRYFDPGAAALARDPVVTCNGSVLRFEAFSSCNGVYARLDVDQCGFDAELLDWGTTNVDVNEPLRAALTGVLSGEPLRLSVGSESLGVETMDAAVIERRVPLPQRWLRGFAEVQIAMTVMDPVAELGTAGARATIRDLPSRSTGNAPIWLGFSAAGVRPTRRSGSGSVGLVGPQRLATMRRLAPHVRGLTVFAPPVVGSRSSRDGPALGPSAWVLDLDSARLTVVLSAELYRGFSGEGGVLRALGAADGTVVEAVAASLSGQACLEPAALVDPERDDVGLGEIEDALHVLAATGRVGYDLHLAAYFHRDLPFDRSCLEGMHPRLRDARTLLAQGGVELGSDAATVRSGDVVHTVRDGPARGDTVRSGDGPTVDPTCTCAWHAKHRGERGPCKHVLAVELARSQAVDER